MKKKCKNHILPSVQKLDQSETLASLFLRAAQCIRNGIRFRRNEWTATESSAFGADTSVCPVHDEPPIHIPRATNCRTRARNELLIKPSSIARIKYMPYELHSVYIYLPFSPSNHQLIR